MGAYLDYSDNAVDVLLRGAGLHLIGVRRRHVGIC